MNMKKWLGDQLESEIKKPIPVLSFPAVQLLGISVIDLISSSELQSEAMRLIAQRCDTGASVSMMDLSVEAQCFGSEIRFSDDEVPSVLGRIITSKQEAEDLPVPEVGTGRTGIYIEAISKAVKKITDRPVFAGVIGPFSLAARLMDITEAMVNCYTEPEMVHLTLQKTARFLTEYIKSYKQTGANGVIMAEPAGGLLSPDFIAEFSSKYIKQIVDETQDDDFLVVYHNCGKVIPLIESILSTGCAAYHFGNAISMEKALELMPKNIITMGNIDPASQFYQGTPESVKAETLKLLGACSKHKNFIISSGCDIPPLSKWENIDAFFDAVKEFYSRN